MNRLLLVIGLFLLSGQGGAAPAKTAEGISEMLRSTLRHYDVNQKEKFLIDFHFSPLHAMRAYRELLLWADHEETSPELAAEVRASVTEGLLAVYSVSGAGVPLGRGPSGAIGIAFEKALPRHTAPTDPRNPDSLRWSGQGRVAVTGPAAIGQSLAAKAVWLRVVGGKEGAILADSLAAELASVTAPPFIAGVSDSVLAPERLNREEGKWRVEDRRSRLFSQASLLLGLLEVKALLADAGVLSPYLREGRLGERTPKAWAGQVDGIVARLVRGLVGNHQDPESGALVESFDPDQGRNKRVMMEDLGLAAEALGAYARVERGPLAEQARAVLRRQAVFLHDALSGDELAPRGWILPSKAPWRGTVSSLSEQVAAQRLLHEAAEATGEAMFSDTARTLHESMQGPFWSEKAGIYRSAAGFTVSAYDGYTFGSVLGWLRRLETVDGNDAPSAAHFIDVVMKRAGLLQCEGSAGGEPDDPEAIIDAEAGALAAEFQEIDLKERGRRTADLIRRVVDRDADSVPGCRYGGGEYGAAPVLVMQTSIRTPFAPPETGLVADTGEGAEK